MTKHLDWDHLRIFLAAHRAGSLRGASEQLGVNHATVRRALIELENALGTRFFDRSADGLTLTQPGELLIEPAEIMERQSVQIARQLTGLDAEPAGTVRVSMPPSFAQGMFAPILASFTLAHPDINIEIIATNRLSDLGRQEADVSIRFASEVDDDVVGRRLLRYLNGAYATPRYLEEHRDLQVDDGTGAHWIGWGRSDDWVTKSPFPNAKVRHAVPGMFMQLEAAAHGLGMVFLPCFMGDSDTRLVRVPGAEPEPSRSIWLLLHGDLQKTARVRAFVDHAARAILSNRAAYES